MRYSWLLVPLFMITGCGYQEKPTTAIAVAHITAPANATNMRTFSWPGGDWSANVAWEARHSMSRRGDGQSFWPVSSDQYGPRWIADWCYTNNTPNEANDPGALTEAIRESFGYVGVIGHDQATSHHQSGWCTFLTRLVLYRSSYGAGYNCHLTMPNFGSGSMYDWCSPAYMIRDFTSAQPGWVILRPSPNEHSAILDRRAVVNGRDGWWVIDGNYVGPWLIGRHFLPLPVLQNDYWAWAPTLATTN